VPPIDASGRTTPEQSAHDDRTRGAPVWKRVFGVVEVVGESSDAVPPGPGATRSARWPRWVPIEPVVVVPHLENAPPVEAIGVGPRSMSQQSHIRLTPRQYGLAVEAIGAIGS